MKSLKIVNRNIKAIKKLLYNLKDVKEGTKEDFDKYYHEKELKEQKIIKADLEVLEILRVLILHNGKSVGYKGIIRDFEVMLRLGKITQEQLDRLKQWLEENEE